MSPANRFRMPMPDRLVLPSIETDRPEPFPKLVEIRELECAACRKICRYVSSRSSHPSSPEFIRPRPDVWLAFVVDPKTDTLELVAACSEVSGQRLLWE